MKGDTILIVDDREFDRILYKEYLGEEDYIFQELDDGKHVLDFLANNHIDLMLLDWQMPQMGGIEVLKMLKNDPRYEQLPIIVITGLEDERVLEEAFTFGSVDFLNKPVRRIELHARVNSALKLHRAKKQLSKQKDELQELNDIIKQQKQELEKSLELKTELIELREQQHAKEIDSTHRQLLLNELDSSKIGKKIQELKKLYEESYKFIKQHVEEPEVFQKMKKMERNISSLLSDQDSHDEFKRLFENIDPNFFKKLTRINPKLTTLDLKHCAYIKLNLDNYEISQLLNVEIKSIQMTRYRIRKKLNLKENQSLREFIMLL